MIQSEQRIAEGILFTDFYQLTMAQLYYRYGLHEKHVQFDHFFRSYPDYGAHKAGYCISAGLEWLLDWMREALQRRERVDNDPNSRTGHEPSSTVSWSRGRRTTAAKQLRATTQSPSKASSA